MTSSSPARARSSFAGFAWIAALALAVVVLHASANVLPPPPLSPSADALDRWLHGAGPLGAAFSLLRLATLALAWYLVVVTLITLTARLCRSHPLAVLSQRLAPPFARIALRPMLGAGLSVAAFTVSMAPASPASARPASPLVATTASGRATVESSPFGAAIPGTAIATVIQRDDHLVPGSNPDEPGSATPPTLSPPVTVTVTPLDVEPKVDERHEQGPNPSTDGHPANGVSRSPGRDPDAASSAASADALAGGTAPAAPAPTTPAGTTGAGPPGTESTTATTPTHDSTPADTRATDAPTATPSPGGEPPEAGTTTLEVAPVDPRATWTIEPGDHLWHVSEQTLVRSWDRAPSLAEIDTYWRSVVAANRDRLVVPDDPDLVFPGQLMVLPPVPEG